MRPRVLVAAICALALVAGCGIMERRLAIRNCRFSLKGVRPSGIDLGGVRFLVTIGIRNPNDIETVLDGFDADFFLNGRRIVQGSHPVKVSIPPGESRDVPLEIAAPYGGIADLVDIIRSGSYKDYRLAGQAYFDTVAGRFSFPVEIAGKFP
ncbi:MAG: LEA type 2 family protein [Deltaproteobacteria bacterium]|nr:LEA type 2 family protein [Deltaproteobacteria bacterium]